MNLLKRYKLQFLGLSFLIFFIFALLIMIHRNGSALEKSEPSTSSFISPSLKVDKSHADSKSKNPGRIVLEQDIEEHIAYFKDSSIPLKTRITALKEISKHNTLQAVETLKNIGNENIYLNRVAISALGNITEPGLKNEAASYLEGKLQNDDALIVCAAISAYAKTSAADSIRELTALLEKNKTRQDGNEEMIASAIVQAMNDIAAPSAVPVLRKELECSNKRGWSLEYGSKIVSALINIDTNEGRNAMGEYAIRLLAKIPEDQLAKQYYESKIAEAKNGAGLIDN